MSILGQILALSFLGSIAGLAGGVLLLWRERIARAYSIYFIAFAAGVMLTTAILELLPEAVEGGNGNFYEFILIGLVAFFLLEFFVLHFHHHEGHKHSLRSVVPLIILSDTLHNFLDGVVIASSFLVDPKAGMVVALATFFHEIPQEIGDFAVLLSTGMSRTKVVLANLLSALATFVGAIATYFFLSTSSPVVTIVLFLSTGMFLYISSADILPDIVREELDSPKWKVALAFLSGILLVAVFIKFLPG